MTQRKFTTLRKCANGKWISGKILKLTVQEKTIKFNKIIFSEGKIFLDVEYQIESFKFQWDRKKNAINKQKHGVAFEDAAFVFLDDNAIDISDDLHSIDEDRRIVIGKVEDVLYVVYTERYEALQIISARKATPKERRWYYGRTGNFYSA